jgi:16S rRNA processing protein RimM
VRLLEVGKAVNTHGIHGGLKIECSSDTPEFLRQFNRLYIGDKVFDVTSFKAHKNAAIVTLKGVGDVQGAQALKGKAVSADVSGIKLPEGRFFIADMIGLPIIENDIEIGRLADVLKLPSHDVYVLEGGRMIPNVPEFVKSIDKNGIIVSLIEGM